MLQIDQKEKLWPFCKTIKTANKYVKLDAVYNAERFILQGNFSESKNPRFIIESGFKSRAGYNGARTV